MYEQTHEQPKRIRGARKARRIRDRVNAAEADRIMRDLRSFDPTTTTTTRGGKI